MEFKKGDLLKRKKAFVSDTVNITGEIGELKNNSKVLYISLDTRYSGGTIIKVFSLEKLKLMGGWSKDWFEKCWQK